MWLFKTNAKKADKNQNLLLGEEFNVDKIKIIK
jgi:hypothetical protein